MNLQGKSPQDLIDILIELAAKTKEEDLKNPETFALVSQLLQLMDPKPEPLPQELVDQLSQIKDKAERFRQAVAVIGGTNPEAMKKLSEAMKAAGLLKSDLEKMSRPAITLPNFKKVPTRPDSDVQPIETTRQKKIFGHKVATASAPKGVPGLQDKVANRVAGGFDRNRLGVSYATPNGPKAAAVVGAMRSKFEEGDEEHKQKMADHKAKKSAALKEWNTKAKAYNAKHNELTAKLSSPTTTGPERGEIRRALSDHEATVPKKMRLPRAPSKKKVKTTDLSPEQATARGRGVDATIHHEAFHNTIAHVEKHYGKKAAHQVKEGILSHFQDETKRAVGNYIQERLGYKRKSPHFSEEIIAHSRDILTNPKKRKSFKEHAGEKADEHIKNLKVGHQKAYEYAKNLKPEDLGKSESLGKAAPANMENSHIVMFPVTIRGQSKDKDSKSPDYHVTLKAFGERGPETHGLEDHVQSIVDRHNVKAPEQIRIKPHKFKHSITGEHHHVLLLDSSHPEIANAHSDLDAIHPDIHPFLPHVTVSKELHDEVKDKGLTAQDLDLKIHPLEYRVGTKTVKKYTAPRANEAFPPVNKAENMSDELKKAVKRALDRSSDLDDRSEFTDINRQDGKHHACVMDFHGTPNNQLEDKIIQNLSALKKGNKESYENASADLKVIGKLAQAPSVPKDSEKTKLFSDEKSNAKTKKNEAATGGQYDTKILYLAPAGLAGRGNLCPGLSAGCKAGCLNTAGMGSMVSKKNPVNDVHVARVKRTRHIMDHPHDAFAQMDKEIESHKKSSAKAGKKPVVRLNGTSDLAFEHFKHPDWNGQNIFERHPDVQFYDYTKRPERVRNNKHSNYHLTFSSAEDNQPIARKLLSEGHNVAVPFGYHQNKFTKKNPETGEMVVDTEKFPLPSEHWGHQVIDGDKHDSRFLDPKGSPESGGKIVGLRAKGDAIHDTSGFVQWGHAGAPNAKPKPMKEGQENKERIVTQGLIDQDKKKKVSEEGGTPLAASEAALKPGMSYNQLKKGWSTSRKYGVEPKMNPAEAKAKAAKAMDAAAASMNSLKPVAQGPKPAPKQPPAGTIAPKKPSGVK